MQSLRDPAKRDSDRERSEVLTAVVFMMSLILERLYEQAESSGTAFPKERDLEDFGRADYLLRKYLRRRLTSLKGVRNAIPSSK